MREMITGSLTMELRDLESPVRRWLDAAFPHAGLVLEEQRLALAAQQKWWEDKHGTGSLPVERPTRDHAMIGTAADWLLGSWCIPARAWPWRVQAQNTHGPSA